MSGTLKDVAVARQMAASNCLNAMYQIQCYVFGVEASHRPGVLLRTRCCAARFLELIAASVMYTWLSSSYCQAVSMPAQRRRFRRAEPGDAERTVRAARKTGSARPGMAGHCAPFVPGRYD